jgi:hypothetical protein
MPGQKMCSNTVTFAENAKQQVSGSNRGGTEPFSLFRRISEGAFTRVGEGNVSADRRSIVSERRELSTQIPLDALQSEILTEFRFTGTGNSEQQMLRFDVP